MRCWAVFSFIAACALAASACGGKVTIKEDEIGQGGSGSSGEPQVCGWPDPVGEVSLCGSVGEGGTCSSVFCDANGNTYEADCTATSCKCKWNTLTKCTCALSGEGDYCAGDPPPCCPSPIDM